MVLPRICQAASDLHGTRRSLIQMDACWCHPPGEILVHLLRWWRRTLVLWVSSQEAVYFHDRDDWSQRRHSAGPTSETAARHCASAGPTYWVPVWGSEGPLSACPSRSICCKWILHAEVVYLPPCAYATRRHGPMSLPVLPVDMHRMYGLCGKSKLCLIGNLI